MKVTQSGLRGAVKISWARSARPSARRFDRLLQRRLLRRGAPVRRDMVARHGGAGEQDALAGEVVLREGSQQAFGDVLCAHEIDFQVECFDGGAGGGADGADAGAEFAQVEAERSSARRRT